MADDKKLIENITIYIHHDQQSKQIQQPNKNLPAMSQFFVSVQDEVCSPDMFEAEIITKLLNWQQFGIMKTVFPMQIGNIKILHLILLVLSFFN